MSPRGLSSAPRARPSPPTVSSLSVPPFRGSRRLAPCPLCRFAFADGCGVRKSVRSLSVDTAPPATPPRPPPPGCAATRCRPDGLSRAASTAARSDCDNAGPPRTCPPSAPASAPRVRIPPPRRIDPSSPPPGSSVARASFMPGGTVSRRLCRQ
eukprot:3366779-Pleurochrysis_carterae.AAC.3